MGIFDSMLNSLVQMDFFQVLFPFLLALAIFYGVFKFAKIEERIGKGPSGLVAIILAFFVMLYAKSIPGLSWLITMGAGSTLAIAVVVLFLIIILGIFGFTTTDIGDRKKWLSLLIVLVIVFAIVVGIWGTNITFLIGLPFVSGADFWAIVVFLIIIAIAWHFMTSEKKEEPSKPKV